MKKLILGTLVLLSAGFRPVLAEEARSLPPAVYAQMKSGGKLTRLWINPKYDPATGFTVGKVTTVADSPFANSVDYLSAAFQRLTVAGSTNVLEATMTELTTIDHGFQGVFGAAMTVEGKVVDKDGQLMLAFSTHAKLENRQTVLDNCKGVCDVISWSLFKDLGKPFQRAMTVKSEVTRGSNPSGLLPPPPPPAEVISQDIGARLLRLEDLKKRGLITDEEYRTHKEDILKGL